MDIARINQILSEMRNQLMGEPVDEQAKPEQHNPVKLSGAQMRLKNLYKKLTANRSDSNAVKATGADR